MSKHLQTMGQQSGRRSWAEPWKIKIVEPLRMIDRDAREKARGLRLVHEPTYLRFRARFERLKIAQGHLGHANGERR
jgi:hypothetical protein